jgi:hypothetical protein
MTPFRKSGNERLKLDPQETGCAMLFGFASKFGPWHPEGGVAMTNPVWFTPMGIEPEVHKVELLESQKCVKVPDIAQQMIEESMGLRSTYTLYKYIAMPLCRTETDPLKLKEILNNREYGTPPDFGSAGVVKMNQQKEEAKAEIVAKEKEVRNAAIEVAYCKEKTEKDTKGIVVANRDNMRNAIIEVVYRKEKTEEEIEHEIAVLEHVVQVITEGGSMKKSIEELPPLTRARFLAAVQKMGLDRKVVVQLLVKDIAFLRGIKKKMEKFSVKELLELVKVMGKLKDKR